MKQLIVVFAGLLGGLLGFGASVLFAIWFAKAKGMSSMDGAHGYFAVAVGLGGGLIASFLAMILCLRMQGVTNVASLLSGAVTGGLTLMLLSGCALGAYWLSAPKLLNQNGAAPQLFFEIAPPAGFDAELLASLHPTLHCNSKERPEVLLTSPSDGTKNQQSILAGRVELVYRASWRLIALDLSDERSILFKLRLPADPTASAAYRKWSPWYLADEVKILTQPHIDDAKSDLSGFKIRYRIEFWREPQNK